jgi:hypothetical protein
VRNIVASSRRGWIIARRLWTRRLPGRIQSASIGDCNRRGDDNIYCGSPSRPCQEAWTDEEGRYELNTWYEHHSLVVSGPEYPPKIKSIMTKTFGHEPKMQMNISISKSPPVPASDTNVRIVGKVTDEKTGEPLVGARVADNIYAGAPDKTCQEAWTDEEGRYVLNTWYEEHSLVVSAPGYPPKLVGFATKILSHEPEVEMDVSIVKGVN